MRKKADDRKREISLRYFGFRPHTTVYTTRFFVSVLRSSLSFFCSLLFSSVLSCSLHSGLTFPPNRMHAHPFSVLSSASCAAAFSSTVTAAANAAAVGEALLPPLLPRPLKVRSFGCSGGMGGSGGTGGKRKGRSNGEGRRERVRKCNSFYMRENSCTLHRVGFVSRSPLFLL